MRRGGESARSRSQRKSAYAEQKDALSAVAVSEPAAGNELHSERNAVSRHDQLQVGGACTKVDANRRQSDVDDEEI